MLLYATLACLCLLSISGCQANQLIAPEIVDDRGTFTVLNSQEFTNTTPRQLHVIVRKYDGASRVPPRECPKDLRARYDATKLSVSAFHRLGADKFAYTWYDETSSGDRETFVVVSDGQCREAYFTPSQFKGDAILVPSVGETFDVIVNDAEFCGKRGKTCRVDYDLQKNTTGRALPFNVTTAGNLDWSTVRIEKLDSGAFLIRGYEYDMYKVMQMNHNTGEVKLLFEISNPNRQMEFVSSDLSYCWILDPSADRRKVFCEMVDERQQLILSKELVYKEPVSLVDVHPMRKEGELFVLTKRVNCKNEEDCWKLYGTEVNTTRDFEHVPMAFPCVGDQKQLTVFDVKPDDSNKKVNLRYACRRNDSDVFGALSIDAKPRNSGNSVAQDKMLMLFVTSLVLLLTFSKSS